MMNKLHFYMIVILLLCVGFKGYSETPQNMEVWNTPVSFELMPVPIIDLPVADMNKANSKYHAHLANNLNEIVLSTNTATIFAPPCDYIGMACDDNDPDTVNDKVGADCICKGEPIAPTCDEVNVTYQINGGLTETGAIINLDETDSLELFANVEDYVVRDPNGVLVPNNKIVGITPENAGQYTVNSIFNLPTPAATPTVHSYSSQKDGTESAGNVLDGNTGSHWHSNWITVGQPQDDPGYPHSIVFDLGENSILSGFSYQARQGPNPDDSHGRIRGYAIYVSNSPIDRGSVVKEGDFEDILALQHFTFPVKQGQYLHFIATSAQNPLHPWASAAEIGINRVTAVASSEETGDARNSALSAVDGRNDTFWHTEWSNATLPQSITLDLGVSSNITGLNYIRRQTGANGNITAYEIRVSDTPDFDGIPSHANGTWENNNPEETSTFAEIRGRYVRLTAMAGVGNFASAAEITVTRPTINMPCTQTITINVNPRNTYAYNDGTWSPELLAPTDNDILIVNQGDATFDSPFTVDKLIVNPGASAIINTTLTTATTILKSESNTFSSLIVNGTINGLITYERWVNQIGTSDGGGNDLISSPVTGVTFNNAFRVANLNIIPENPDPIKKGEFAFAPYNVEDGAYQNFNIEANYSGFEPIVPGVGYRAATNVVGTRTGNTLIFTGSAEKGNVSITITPGGNGKSWNLIGNPYPSYLHFRDFFNANRSEFNSQEPYQAIYGYKGTVTEKWEIWNLATTEPEDLIAPGQGFFVKANSSAGNVFFTPAMRRVGSSDDFIEGRSQNSNKVLSKLNLSTASNSVSTRIYFIEGTTRGLDSGYDAAAYGATQVDFSLFTNLLEDNSGLDIAVQSLPYNDFNNVIVPLGMKAKAGVELSISIDDLSTLPSNINVYLEDTQNNTLTLLNDGDFKFTPTAAINGSGRFNVHYASKTLSVDDLIGNDNLRIYTTSTPKTLFIKGQLVSATMANLYDIQGRLVSSKNLNPNTTENSMDISTLGAGVYVVKVASENQTKTQKVLIK